MAETSQATPEPSKTPAADEPSIAVLPFVNMSGDGGIVQAGDNRLLAPLKGNPRFNQMLQDIGLR